MRARFGHLPINWHGEFFTKTINIMKLAIEGAVFVDQARELHVIAAIFGDVEQLTFAEPLNGLEAFGGFLDAERGGGDGLEGEAMLEAILKFDEHVEGGHLAQVEGGVSVEHFEIETKVVEADDQIGS